MSIATILLIVALICFLVGAFPQVALPLNIVSLGLFFVTLSWLVGSGGIKLSG